jgi:pimeloyl-ACP methyl ester carboxylesterase
MVTEKDNRSLYRSATGYTMVLAHYDGTLAGMGIPYREEVVETGFGETHVVICGNPHGKPLLLWHGLNANAVSWVQWIPAFAPDYHVYALDAIGGLGKSAPSRPAKKGPAYGEWAAQAVRALDLSRANMVGASNGGWMIGKLASVAPELIGSAVLMSSAGFMPLDYWGALKMVPRMLFKTPDEMAQGLLAMVSAPGVPVDPFWLGYFQLILESGFRSEQLAPALRDDEIRCLTAPTCLLMAEHEASFNPYRAVKRGLSLLPNVIAAEIVPGVGHSMVHPEHDWVIRRVRSFFERYAV